MADQDAAIANHPPRFYKLPDFWRASLAAWFRVIEAQFQPTGQMLSVTNSLSSRLFFLRLLLGLSPTSSPLLQTRATMS